MQKFLYQTKINTVLGLLFSTYRSNKNLDQYEAANIANISKSSMSKLESGQMHFNIENIFLLCTTYNIELIKMIKDFTLMIKILEDNNVLVAKNNVMHKNIPILTRQQIADFIKIKDFE